MNLKNTENHLREAVMIFFIQKNIILFTTCLITVAAAAVAFLTPPVYEVSGSLLLKGNRMLKNPEAIEETQAQSYTLTSEDFYSEMAMLTSREVIEKTLKVMQEKGIPLPDKIGESGMIRQSVEQVRESLTTEILPETKIIRISYAGKDPENALELLENMMEQYTAYRSEIYTPKDAEQFYANQAAHFYKSLMIKEKELTRYISEESGSPVPWKNIESNFETKKDLQIRLSAARDQWIELEETVKNLDQALNSKKFQFFASVDNAPINRFGEKLEDMVIEKQRLLREYHSENVKVKRIDEQIRNIHKILTSEVRQYAARQKNKLESTILKHREIQENINELTRKNLASYNHHLKIERLEKERDLLQNSYNTFVSRREEAKINNHSDMQNLFSVRIINHPNYSGDPIFPPKKTLLVLGLLVGFLSGCSIGFLREYFDHTFKTPEEVIRITGLPTILSIPEKKKSPFL